MKTPEKPLFSRVLSAFGRSPRMCRNVPKWLLAGVMTPAVSVTPWPPGPSGLPAGAVSAVEGLGVGRKTTIVGESGFAGLRQGVFDDLLELVDGRGTSSFNVAVWQGPLEFGNAGIRDLSVREKKRFQPCKPLHVGQPGVRDL